MVVEKEPLKEGVRTCWEASVKITITASLCVFPEMVIILLSTTSSSRGESRERKKDVEGVGEGEVLIERSEFLGTGTVLVA